MLIFMTLSGYKNMKYVFNLIKIVYSNIINYKKNFVEFSNISIQKYLIIYKVKKEREFKIINYFFICLF
jgi:hypothetical protein